MALTDLAMEFTPAHSLFKRCVQCPPEAPSCPACASNRVCKQTLGSCDSCASATCVAESVSGSLQPSAGSRGGGSNIGAIVGSVLGSVIFISIVVFCIWKFWFKGRRHEADMAEEEWDEEEDAAEKSNASVFTREARSRASTHTVASLASTVLTRASNIIQIAYIPGVTNRSNADPNMLVPPVPPIPIATAPPSVSNSSQFEDQMLFMPGDLRGSTYSDMSSFTTTEGARRPGSIAPSLQRASLATTIYCDSALVNPMPAQQLVVSKAAVVSVKANAPLSTPPVPTVDFAKHGASAVKPVLIKMPSSGGSSSASASLKPMKPVALNIIRKNKMNDNTVPSSASSTGDHRTSKRSTVQSLAPSEMTVDTHRRARQSAFSRRTSNMTTYSDSTIDDEDDHERSRRSLLDKRNTESAVATPSLLDTRVEAGPFSDAAEVETPTRITFGADLLTGSPRGSEQKRGESPFEDPA